MVIVKSEDGSGERGGEQNGRSRMVRAVEAIALVREIIGCMIRTMYAQYNGLAMMP